MATSNLAAAMALMVLLAGVCRGADRVETLYERKLTESEKDRYSSTVGIYSLDKGLSIDEVREKYQTPKSTDITKVEVLLDEQNTPVSLRVTHLGLDLARQRREEEWRQQAASRLAVNRDVGDIQHLGTNMWLTEPYAIYAEGVTEIGWVREEFKTPSGIRISAHIYQLPKGELTVHEFLHEVIKHDLRVLRDTPVGTVVAFTIGENTKNDDPHTMRGVAWMAKDNVAIYAGGAGADPQDIVRIYESKLQSILPGDLRIDKTEWGRTEVDITLRRLESALLTPEEAGGERNRKGDVNAFLFHLVRLGTYVSLPIDSRVPDLSQVDAKSLRSRLDHLRRWWAEHGNETRWDEKWQMLVAKGQSPQDIQEQQRKLTEQAKREAKPHPMTKERVEALTAQLVEEFERKNQEWESRVRGERDEAEREKVSWKRLGEGQWELRYPTVPAGLMVVRKYTGPKIEVKDSGRRLRAVFNIEVTRPDSKFKAEKTTETYEFTEEASLWIHVE